MTRKPVVWMFGGQGSQSYHMGAGLYSSDRVFRRTVDEMSRRIECRVGFFLPDLLYDPTRRRSDPFDRTLQTHPALFIVQYALSRSLMDSGFRPDHLLGYSLGEFVALAVAEALDPFETLELVLEQAIALEKHCVAGGMTAILAPVDLFESQTSAFADTWLAAVNHDNHWVISGPEADLERAETFLRSRAFSFVRLPVRFGFHSPMIDAVAGRFLQRTGSLTFRQPKIPVISSAHGGEVIDWNAHSLWEVARRSVNFAATVSRMAARGSFVYVDLGSAGTMANFVKYRLGSNGGHEIYGVFSPFGRDAEALLRLKDILGAEHRGIE